MKYRSFAVVGAVLAGLALLAGVPGFMAFESSLVNINARVVQPPPPVQKLRSGPDPVTVGTYQEWFFTIVVSNPFDFPIEDVLVTDHFGAELDVVIVSHTGGTATTEVVGQQARIAWTIDLLDPGHSQTLVVRAFTTLNPGGQQSYSSPGRYEQNSGATMRWIDPNGHQDSASTDSIVVTVVEPAGGDDVSSDSVAPTDDAGVAIDPPPSATATPPAVAPVASATPRSTPIAPPIDTPVASAPTPTAGAVED